MCRKERWIFVQVGFNRSFELKGQALLQHETNCRCFAWFEGQKCEKRMRIPYRPLSERMLQEPFWLGLITVFVVLAVIGLVWCAKRHFPEKIEKLLQEEADRNRRNLSNQFFFDFYYKHWFVQPLICDILIITYR